MNKLPAFQFYPGDFISDLKVATMNMEERGIYITLLSHEWLERGLPNDPSELKVICGNPENWQSSWRKVSQCFCEKNGKLFNKRLEKERRKISAWKKKSREGGIKSGISRRKKVEPITKGGSTKAEPKGNSSSSSSSSSSNKNKDKNIYAQAELERLWEKWWGRYPKKIDKGEAKKAWLANINKGIDPQVLEDALTGYINVLNNKQTDMAYIKYGKTFLYPGNVSKNIPPTWEQYLPYADPKYQAKARL